MYAVWNSAEEYGAGATSPSTADTPAAKRRRVSENLNGRRTAKATRACDLCKSKKARCSGSKPCTKCSARGLECTYESQYLRGRPPTPPSSTIEVSTRIQEQQEQNEATNASRRSPSGDADEQHPVSLSRSSPELEAAEINGQYVDRTSGLSFLERARSRLKQRHSSRIEGFHQPLTAAGDKPLLDSTLDGSSTSPAVLPNIPDQDRATELLDLYFEICVASYKPLHRPTVDGWYSTLTQNIAQGKPMTESIGNARVAVLFGVFAVATYHAQKSSGVSDDVASLSTSDSFFRCSTALTETETGTPHLESAQARLLQVFYLLATCRMNRAWYIFGNLIQILSALGMHRRSRRRLQQSRSASEFIYAQCRIRTFWSTYILDRYMGVVLGRPRHFHDKDIDQDYPARIDDNDQETTSSNYEELDSDSECHLDGFIWNIKLAQLVDEISDSLYAIKPSPEVSRIETARAFAAKLEIWHHSLPALLKAKPTSLARGFRRQCVAVKMAHQHAILHLYRPFLLGRSRAEHLSAGDTMLSFRKESIRHCIQAARTVMRTTDDLAREGKIIHAYWWTHYVAFCALTVTYNHLAQATATNSPSRRYSIILEELQSQVLVQRSSNTRRSSKIDNANVPIALAGAIESGETNNDMRASTLMADVTVHDLPQSGDTDFMSDGLHDPFMDWQTSDWLELDASAYGVIPGLSPDFQWLHSA
ncbi:Activator of stress proteins 1 [Cercospora beticola]|uniref:Activator of stress proteins 1 n=1 Tax=Cercospora beticola TaxID=122368 RepID=A0A2G5I691_CERBT|nr:Activator of stress proteins 1 [Cercospora beticola]PIA99993.1 Activator of stress proteins 1 [Cercospora beticola]WPB00742.1 hypothetical protein RHO25_005362 [Cercospora beticola]